MSNQTDAALKKSAMVNKERRRFDAVAAAGRLALIESFGPHRLSRMVEDAFIENLIHDSNIYAHCITGDTTMVKPDDRAAMRALIKDAAKNDEIVSANLAHTDKLRRQALEAEFIQTIGHQEALRLHRGNLLDQKRDEFVKDKLGSID